MNKHSIELLIDIILSNINVVPLDEYKKCIPEAFKIMKDIDENDTAFLALALCLKADGIWSNDQDLYKQQKMKTYSTKDLITIFGF